MRHSEIAIAVVAMGAFVVLAVAYTASMVIIVAIAKPYDHSVWTATGALLLIATVVTIAVLSWRDICSFGGLMPWGKLPVPLRLIIGAGMSALRRSSGFPWS